MPERLTMPSTLLAIDITRVSHEVTAKERAVEHELDQLLSKRTDLEKRFLLLQAPITEVWTRVCAHSSAPVMLESEMQ